MKKSIITLLLSITLLPFSLLAQNFNPNSSSLNLFPYHEFIEIPCTGDIVLLDGNFFILDQVSQNDKRSIYNWQIVPRHITGINTRTGQTYRLVGSEQSMASWSNVDSKQIVKGVVKFHFLGEGNDANFYIYSHFFNSYDSNGELKLDFYQWRSECR